MIIYDSRFNFHLTAYAYVQGENNLCKQSNVKCNDSGFGASISRGSFSFVASMCVQALFCPLLCPAVNESGADCGQFIE